jgi:dihydrofolate reductase
VVGQGGRTFYTQVFSRFARIERGDAMGLLIYSMNVSLDGFMRDASGSFDWAEPKKDVHEYINEIEMKQDVLVYGRKMYEIMSAWEDLPDLERQPGYIREYSRIWKSKKKIVFSKSLKECFTSNTYIKNDFLAVDILELKDEVPGNIGIGGADLASEALDRDLVDEVFLFVYPVLVGNGKRWIKTNLLKGLRLLEMRSFDADVAMLHYMFEK